MTAQVAILNKTAVALATDSACTVLGNPRSGKVYNTATKIFTLSKYHPVGIMINGNSYFMGVPWETVVKLFRESLHRKFFPRLRDYADAFLSFLSSETELFSADRQQEDYGTLVRLYYAHIRADIRKAAANLFKEKSTVAAKEVGALSLATILSHLSQWKALPRLDGLPQGLERRIRATYAKICDEQRTAVFEKLPLPPQAVRALRDLAVLLFTRDKWFNTSSGVVIAGFGQKEIFPSLCAYQVGGVVCSQVKHKAVNTTHINFKTTASIIPFAQSEMVTTFMEGIDPNYAEFQSAYLRRLFEEYPSKVLQAFGGLAQKAKTAMIAELQRASEKLLTDLTEALGDYRRENHWAPIVGTVSLLPKEELAAMAEALVNLTSFKRHVSPETETVGGPIDVAVISRGDGFIWIKRKHYFDPKLNAHFFANYFAGDKNE